MYVIMITFLQDMIVLTLNNLSDHILILGIVALQSQLLLLLYFVSTITVIGERKCQARIM